MLRTWWYARVAACPAHSISCKGGGYVRRGLMPALSALPADLAPIQAVALVTEVPLTKAPEAALNIRSPPYVAVHPAGLHTVACDQF